MQEAHNGVAEICVLEVEELTRFRQRMKAMGGRTRDSS